MVKIGMIIGERYEILEKIGTGGMSDVYKAKCHKLNRFVAVKVLKQEFSENANFVSKFRIEAQAAAGLMHPNIVNVYDVGEENGIHYIVMELVEGITLKKYIEKKARLSYKEAVSIAIQVSMGIEAAHNSHIIHRDIKPQNIIISRDGKVKVTDFGIAKAATSNTITSNVMGSVHYTSPEQARGGYSDEKSDIYSLGITMFEMLTGRVPFNGETTVAIAIKHIQEEMPSPKEFVPEIPAAVESIVLKCCQKSPDRRYQNMPKLIGDLKQSLINPDENFVVQDDPNMEGGTRMISDNDVGQIKRRVIYTDNNYTNNNYDNNEYTDNNNESDYHYAERGNTMRLREQVQAAHEEEEETHSHIVPDDDYDYDPKMERITTMLAIIVGVAICIVIIVLALKIFGNKDEDNNQEHKSPIITTEETSEENTENSSTVQESSENTETEISYVPMPAIEGETLEDAQKALEDLGLVPDFVYEESDTVSEGNVIQAQFSTGSEVEVGSTVTVTISSGPQGIEVPDVSGYSFEEANTRLVSLGFLVNKTENYSDTVEAGLVISQTPTSGNKVTKGSVITVTVSLGEEQTKVRVPNLVGLSEEDGKMEATEAGLQIGNVTHVYSDEVPQGHICYQSYSQGSYVEEGTVLELKVSLGVEQITYKCNMSISAPTAEEAPDYMPGTEVGIKLVTDDEQVLLETVVTGFPQSANYYGLSASGGTIIMTYTVTLGGTTTTDPETGETINIPGTTEERSFTRRVEFTQE